MTAYPPSTLLQPGTTTLPLQVATDEATACRWARTDVPYASMPNAFSGDGSTSHASTLTGLSGGLSVAVFYVQCAAYAGGPPLVLAYRSLPDSGNAPFPRLGNLWGSGNYRGHPEGLAYAASRASLWLGSDWNAVEIAELRAANAYTLVTTSINACETNMQTLPDAFYLTNITQPASTKGRLQSWPGAWRLDMTNPDVQSYLSSLMYCLVVYGGSGYGSNPSCNNATAVPPMLFDGLFIDNVFLDDGAAVNSQDIFHNSFIPLDRTTGAPFVDFNGKWRAGMLATLRLFRASMPHAVMDGHAMDISDGDVAALFNAISIGFTTVDIIERHIPFADGFNTYAQWMALPTHEPRVTMVESAVRFQLGYGFGFDRDLQTAIAPACINSHTAPGAPMPGIGDACHALQPPKLGYMPPETYLLARAEYAYMRFGLGYALLLDGFFTHELGDSWHGQDWDYDELHFFLGAAAGGATPAQVLSPTPPPAPPPVPLTQAWSLYVRSPATANASWALDADDVPFAGAPASAHVDVDGTAPSADGIDLSQVVGGLRAGGYQLSFWARASVAGAPVHLNARKDGGDWHSFGLDADVVFGTSWQQVNVSFVSVADGSAGRLSWWVGGAAPGTALLVNSPTLVGAEVPLPVLTRDFACGAVVLNAHTAAVTVQLNASAPPLRRLAGAQAPRWQLFIDDSSSAFTPTAGAWATVALDNGYDGASPPTQEEVRPSNGFWQHWGAGAHLAPAGGAAATFALAVPEAGAYNISLWWPQAVPARASWAAAMRATISPGGAGATLDLTSQGGNAFFLVAADVQLTPASVLTIECPAAGGACVADAVLLESAARFNDASEADTVTLQPMDAIVLAKKDAPPGCTQAAAPRP